jgi:pimeloyl-ACP methyl ester carboxylesterase
VSGHWVVLLHGQPGSGADWQQVADRLPDGLGVVALDRPGYGASPQPAGGFAAGARAVVAELDTRGIDRAVLVGHSYGGGVALAAAQLAPERVAALVLLASVGPGCLTWADWMLAGPVSGEFCAGVVWWLTPPLARAVLGAARLLRRRPLRPDQAVSWQTWGNAHGPVWRSFLTEQRALIRELNGLTAALPAVTQPVLLVADPRDMIVPVRSTQRLAAALPGARVQMLDGPGHHLPRRAAPEIAAAITEFLDTLDSRGRPPDPERRAA